jgi:Tfp pilus assembly protein PilN
MSMIDFTPEWYLERRHTRRDRRRRVGYVGALLVLMVAWWSVNRGMIRSAEAALQGAQQGRQQVLAMRAELDRLRTQRGKLREQIQRFQTMGRCMSPTVILAELSHLLPPQTRLENLALHSLAGPLESSGPRPRSGRGSAGGLEQARHSDFKVSVLAQARDNAALLQLCLNLQSSPLFEFADFGGIHTRRIAGGTIEERKIDLYVLGMEHIE